MKEAYHVEKLLQLWALIGPSMASPAGSYEQHVNAGRAVTRENYSR